MTRTETDALRNVRSIMHLARDLFQQKVVRPASVWIALMALALPAFALTTTTTVLTSSAATTPVAQAVTLTATVTGATPTGSVTFKDGATILGTGTIAAGKATWSASFTTSGSHTLTAVYAGDTNNATSTSTALAETVTARTTTTVLTSSATTVLVGQSVTLTATVAGTNATGNVTFKDGTTSIGTGAVAGGVATLSTSFATKAAHSLTAVYSGNANNLTSTSAALTETVNARSTTTTLVASPSPGTVAQTVTLTATVVGTNTTGNVTFKDGTTTLGTRALSAGVATYAATFVTSGAHSLTAVYAGDTNNTTSTSTAFAETVAARTSSTVLTSSVAPSNVAQATTLTATVTGSSPTGTVTFKDGTTTLGTGTIAAGKATYAATFLTAGAHSLTAVYAGDANNQTSTSVALAQTVNTRTTTTALASASNPAKIGQSATLTATVTGTTPTGTVTFKDGATILGTGTVSAGKATYAATFTTTGSHGLVAVYAGDVNNATSTSTALTQTVNLATSGTALTTSTSPTGVGQSTTLTATVNGVSPTGTVTFMDGGTTLGSQALAAGQATLSASFATAGSHTLTATYSGDASNAASGSGGVVQQVTAGASTTGFVVSPNPVGAGRDATLTATVTGSSPTGYVSFREGGTEITAVPLSSGSAVLVWSFGPGTHALSAVYLGDGNNNQSTSASVNEVVQINPTTTAMTTSSASPLLGQSVTLTVTVTGFYPSGQVSVSDGATYLGGGAISAAGTFSFSTSFSTAGTHNLIATYNGDSYNAAGSSPVLAEVAGATATTTTLTANPNPVNSLGLVTMTAAVTGSGATGTVTFKDGANTLGTAPLSNGTASFPSYQLVTAGSHSLTAVYSGDATYGGSTSAVLLETVNLNATSIALAATPSPAQEGANVSLTASLTSAGAGTGTITFKDGATVLGSVTSAGTGGSIVTTFSTPGSHSLTAVYSGGVSESPSTSAVVALTVTTASSAVVVASSLNPAVVGQSVPLTATVTGLNPTGQVTFKDSGATLGSAAVNASGVASLQAVFRTTGSHNVAASYAGDANNAPSASSSITQNVNIGGSTTVLTSAANPVNAGQSVLLTGTVNGPNASGTMTFKDGSTTLGSSPVSAGAGSLNANFASAGPHSLTVVYSGDGNYTGSTSSVLIENVASGGSTTTLSANPMTANLNAAVVLTASVVGTNPTGSVTFKDGGTTLGSSSLSGGSAVLNTSFGTAGSHSLTAVYAGDGSNAASTSSAVVETVHGGAATSVQLTSSAVPAILGQAVTLTATVSGASPTGTVTFTDGGALLATQAVSAGVATFSTSFGAAGLHNLVATYNGDANNASAVSATLFQGAFASITTTTTLTSAQNPIGLGATAQLIATVAGNTPTGYVEFLEGSTSLGAAQVGAISPGIAQLNLPLNRGASHSIKARFGGDAGNSPSVSNVYVQNVTLTATSIHLDLMGANPNLQVISPEGAVQMSVQMYFGNGSFTGRVTYYDGSTVLGTSSFIPYGSSSGFTAHLTALGNHTLTAVYTDGDYNAGSTSAPVVVTVSPTLLVSSVNPARTGQSVLLTATVGGTNPTGTVNFMDGGTSLGSAPLSGGTASLSAVFTTQANHNLTANYSGDGSNPASISPTFVQFINPTPTAVLTASVSSVTVQRPFLLTLTMMGAVQPTGVVTFWDGGTSLGTSTLSNGVATYSATLFAGGAHSLTASYPGDANNAPTVSNVLIETATYNATTTTLTSSLNPAPVGQTVYLNALVTDNYFGQVTFLDGETVLGRVNVTPLTAGAGSAELAVSFVDAGVHDLVAKFTDGHSASVSNVVFEQVGSGAAVSPGNMTWLYRYDALGHLTRVTDPNGNQTVRGFDNLGRLVKSAQSGVAGSRGPITTMGYDGSFDQPIKVIDPRSLVTTYSLDGFGNSYTTTSPDTGMSTSAYTNTQVLSSMTDARGKQTGFLFDSLLRLTGKTYADSTATLFEYDGGAAPTPASVGKLTMVTDESGSTVFTYDGYGQVLSKVQKVGTKTFTLNYTWGATGSSAGKVTAMRYPSGHQVNYAYDTAGRVSGVTVNPVNANGIGTNLGSYLNVLSAVAYNGDNRLLGWTWADNAPYVRGYDGFGRLSAYPVGYPAGTGIASGSTRTLGYDNAARITGFSHANVAGTQAALAQGFGYDALDRVTSQTTSASSYGFAFDANGNRTSRTVGATTFTNTVDPASNRLTQVQTGTSTPVTTPQTFDLAGNLTSDGNATYAYSDRGRMKSATVGGSAVAYLYNGLEQRVSKTGALVPTGAAYYMYDEAGRVIGEYDANLVPVAETVYIGSTPVAVLKETGTAAASTLQLSVGNVYSDQLDTPRVVTRNTDEAILWRWDGAEAFGATVPVDNPAGVGIYKFNQRFPGQISDFESGNFYNWNRDYRPSVGRYVQSDPIGLAGGMNTYAYVGGNPISGIDPRGLDNPGMGPYSVGVTVYLYGGNAFGHVGIGANGGASLGYYGLGVNISGALSSNTFSAGIRPDALQQPGGAIGAVQIPTTVDQADRVKQALAGLAANPGKYSATANNCSQTAAGVLSAAGINAPNTIFPNVLFMTLQNRYGH